MDDQERDRGGFRVAAGVFDFFGVVINALLILGLLAVMIALFTWVKNDLSETFAGIGQNFNEAVVVGTPVPGETPVPEGLPAQSAPQVSDQAPLP